MDLNVRAPVFRLAREITVDGQSYHDLYEGEVPEEIMAFADQVRGNGEARVAVGGDMAMKDFGNGVSVSVTISLSTHQDDQTIASVVRTLGQWQRFYTKEQFDLAYAEFQQLYAQKHPDKAPMVQSGPPTFKP